MRLQSGDREEASGVILALILFAVASSARGPIGPLAGGRLRGEPGSAPLEDWSAVPDDVEEYARVRAALEQKYRLDPGRRDPEREAWIFRLEPRTP